MRTKLILVEGLPGSVKTSTARFVAEWLRHQGVRCQLFLEGDLAHPADFESVACFRAQELADRVRGFPKEAGILQSAAWTTPVHTFIPYGKLLQRANLPETLQHELQRHDVYTLPSADYGQLIRQRWHAFAQQHQDHDGVVIFECSFLQNPITQLFVYNDAEELDVHEQIIGLGETVSILNPVLFYLNPADVHDTIARVSQERPTSWLEFVIWYHTQQGYGLRRGLQGFRGYIEVLRQRRALELALLNKLPMNMVQLDNPQADWSDTHRQIAAVLERVM